MGQLIIDQSIVPLVDLTSQLTDTELEIPHPMKRRMGVS